MRLSAALSIGRTLKCQLEGIGQNGVESLVEHYHQEVFAGEGWADGSIPTIANQPPAVNFHDVVIATTTDKPTVPGGFNLQRSGRA